MLNLNPTIKQEFKGVIGNIEFDNQITFYDAEYLLDYFINSDLYARLQELDFSQMDEQTKASIDTNVDTFCANICDIIKDMYETSDPDDYYNEIKRMTNRIDFNDLNEENINRFAQDLADVTLFWQHNEELENKSADEVKDWVLNNTNTETKHQVCTIIASAQELLNIVLKFEKQK